MFDVHITAIELRNLLDDLEPVTRIGHMRDEPVAWVVCTAGSLCVGVRIETDGLRVVSEVDYGPGEDPVFLDSRPYRTARGAARSVRQQIAAKQATLNDAAGDGFVASTSCEKEDA